MTRRRRSFTPEYKAEVVGLVRDGGKAISPVARDLGLTESAVRKWVARSEVDAGRGAPEVLTTADSACYAAKEQGRNRIQVYRPGDEVLGQFRNEMKWVTRITEALEDNRFRLLAQTFASVAAATQCGRHEVLLRMVGENGESILPGAFLPAAGRYGLLTQIDTWVVKNVLDWYASACASATRTLQYQPGRAVVELCRFSSLSYGAA
jgi:transposase-like protein